MVNLVHVGDKMDEEVRDRFNYWWDSEGRDYADKEGGQMADLHKLKKVFEIAWMNGAYVAETEIIKRRL